MEIIQRPALLAGPRVAHAGAALSRFSGESPCCDAAPCPSQEEHDVGIWE